MSIFSRCTVVKIGRHFFMEREFSRAHAQNAREKIISKDFSAAPTESNSLFYEGFRVIRIELACPIGSEFMRDSLHTWISRFAAYTVEINECCIQLVVARNIDHREPLNSVRNAKLIRNVTFQALKCNAFATNFTKTLRSVCACCFFRFPYRR